MEQLVNFVIRPPRAEYDPRNDLLDQEFMLKGKWFRRKDLEVKNSRGDILQCSHYVPTICPEGKPLPCVIYCHGNSGCRADASEAAIILLPSNITVFTLDFSGSGLSGGDYVTLGWNEKDDLISVVNYLRADGNVSLIGLWGRSMGAVTSLMYGAEDPSIAGIVLDSPFSDLVDLMMELVDTYRIRLPKFTVKFAIQYMRRVVQKRAKFDIMELNTIKVAKSCFVPVLLGHAVDDDFIQPHHSDRIFDAYAGDKNIIKFEGDHNSPRPQFYFDSISIFFNNVLQPPEDEIKGAYFNTSNDYFGNGSWSSMNDIGFADDLLSTPTVAGSATSSTEDAINQLRSKRPMSRIEVPSDISSTEKQSNAEGEGAEMEAASSESKMISFELSNGRPYGPHVPAAIEDDDYVEYSLDIVADFPCNLEEEERMFMEAVMESLKDLETRHPRSEVKDSLVCTAPLVPSQKNGFDDSSTNAHGMPSRADPESAMELNAHDSTPGSPPHTLVSPAGPPLLRGVQSAREPLSTGASTDADDARKNAEGSANSDKGDGTKATVTVVKNPASNIIDGLFRRWDLNFFRSR